MRPCSDSVDVLSFAATGTYSWLRFLVLGPWVRVQARERNGRYTSSWRAVTGCWPASRSNLPHAGFWASSSWPACRNCLQIARSLKHKGDKGLHTNFIGGIFIRKMSQEQSFFLF